MAAEYDVSNTQFWRRTPTEQGMKLERVLLESDPFHPSIDFTKPIVLLLPGRMVATPTSQKYFNAELFEERKKYIAGSIKTLELALGATAIDLQIIAVSYHSDYEPNVRMVQMRSSANSFTSDEAKYVYDKVLAKAQNTLMLVGFSYGTTFCQELANECSRLNDIQTRDKITCVGLGTISSLPAITENGFSGTYFMGTNDSYLARFIPDMPKSDDPTQISYLSLREDVAVVTTPIPTTIFRMDRIDDEYTVVKAIDNAAHEPSSYCLALEGSNAFIKGREVPAFQHATYARYILNAMACRSIEEKFNLGNIMYPAEQVLSISTSSMETNPFVPLQTAQGLQQQDSLCR